MSTALPPRIKAFRQNILLNISHKPNARSELEVKHLPELLIVFVNWAYRFVPPRPRSVSFEPDFFKQPHVAYHGAALAALANAVERGDDLQPYLSTRLLGKPGFVRRSGAKGAAVKGMAWQDGQGHAWDKDSCLNNYDLHHLHLGAVTDHGRHVARSSEVAFIRFSRDHARFVHIGSHDFHSETLGEAVAKANARQGLILKGIRPPRPGDDWSEEERRQVENAGLATTRQVGDELVLAARQVSSGDSIRVVRHVSHIKSCLHQIDARLDDPFYANELFVNALKQVPAQPDFEWRMRFTDLMLCEAKTEQMIIIAPGLA
jgi:hypothetical protein